MQFDRCEFMRAVCDGNVSLVKKKVEECCKKIKCHRMNELLYLQNNRNETHLEIPPYVPEFDQFDEFGFTPLMIVIRLWYISVKRSLFTFASRYWAIIRLLLENGADSKKRSPVSGWNTLADAVACNSHVLTTLLIHHQVIFLRRILKNSSLPRIVYALENIIPDFRVTLNFRVSSLIPGVSLIAPNEKIVITKYKTMIRLDQNVFAEARLGECEPPQGVSAFLMKKKSPASIIFNFTRWPPSDSSSTTVQRPSSSRMRRSESNYHTQESAESRNDNEDYFLSRIMRSVILRTRLLIRRLESTPAPLPADSKHSELLDALKRVLLPCWGGGIPPSNTNDFYHSRASELSRCIDDLAILLPPTCPPPSGLEVETERLRRALSAWLDVEGINRSSFRAASTAPSFSLNTTTTTASHAASLEESKEGDVVLVDGEEEAEDVAEAEEEDGNLYGGVDCQGRGIRVTGQGFYHSKRKWMRLFDPLNEKIARGRAGDTDKKAVGDAENLMNTNGNGAIRGDLDIKNIVMKEKKLSSQASKVFSGLKGGESAIVKNWFGSTVDEVKKGSDGKQEFIKFGKFWCRKFDVSAVVALTFTKQRRGDLEAKFTEQLRTTAAKLTSPSELRMATGRGDYVLHVLNNKDFDEKLRQVLPTFRLNALSSSALASTSCLSGGEELSKKLHVNPLGLVPMQSKAVIDASLIGFAGGRRGRQRRDSSSQSHSEEEDDNSVLFEVDEETDSPDVIPEEEEGATLMLPSDDTPNVIVHATSTFASPSACLRYPLFSRQDQEISKHVLSADDDGRMAHSTDDDDDEDGDDDSLSFSSDTGAAESRKDNYCFFFGSCGLPASCDQVRKRDDETACLSLCRPERRRKSTGGHQVRFDLKGHEVRKKRKETRGKYGFFSHSLVDGETSQLTVASKKLDIDSSFFTSPLKEEEGKTQQPLIISSQKEHQPDEFAAQSPYSVSPSHPSPVFHQSAASEDVLIERQRTKLMLDEASTLHLINSAGAQLLSPDHIEGFDVLGRKSQLSPSAAGESAAVKSKQTANKGDDDKTNGSSANVFSAKRQLAMRLLGMHYSTGVSRTGDLQDDEEEEEEVSKAVEFELLSSPDVPLSVDTLLLILSIFSDVSPELTKLKSFIDQKCVRDAMGSDCPIRVDLPLVMGTSVVITVEDFKLIKFSGSQSPWCAPLSFAAGKKDHLAMLLEPDCELEGGTEKEKFLKWMRCDLARHGCCEPANQGRACECEGKFEFKKYEEVEKKKLAIGDSLKRGKKSFKKIIAF
eukprot:GDKJ01056108.1.p1 GENE.GDKJ01056108.1~~GDKJ01056108.1.p1  ORF type:complete len:1270 (-),score=322.01 GDKJ01056108.1:165-3974(-)